jgi:hypothetical protein
MADTDPTELNFGADGLFAADLSDGLAAAIALIGTGIALAIWFGSLNLVHGAAVLLSVLSAH